MSRPAAPADREKPDPAEKTNKPPAMGEKWAHLTEAPRKTTQAVARLFREQKKF